MADLMTRACSMLVDEEEDHGCRELPESACGEVPRNAARLVAGLTLQKLGDRIGEEWALAGWPPPDWRER